MSLRSMRCGAAALGLCLWGAAAAAASSISSFGLAILPDTQFYSRYATPAEGSQYQNRYGSDPFNAQTAWLAQHVRTLGIPFVAHLGDVVDQQGLRPQWLVASDAMKRLEDAAVPYSILAGNHDVVNGCGYRGVQNDCTDEQRGANDPYLQHFPTSRAQKNATFGGRSPNGWHEYHVFEAQGQRFLVLALSWRVSDSALAWARQVMRNHPTLPVIVTSHEVLMVDSDGQSGVETDYSRFLWERLVRDNDQIFMVIGGHHHGAAHLVRQNAYGRPVLQFVVDYQMAYMGGNGLMRVFEFDLTNNQIKAVSFSPWVPTKPPATRNEYDQAWLTDANNQFTLELNFAQRFAAFAPGFKAGPPNRERPLVDSLRDLVLANYSNPAAPVTLSPVDGNDYPKPAQTLAHWRFDAGTRGQPVSQPEGAPALRDLVGQNHLQFNGKPGDVLWSADRHALSAAQGSACFVTNSRANVPENAAFFFTHGPLSQEQFLDSGYTVEAVVKIAKDFTPENNRWMNVLTRDMPRGWLPNYAGGDPQASSLLFAVSNLREYQWEPTTLRGSQHVPRANWSGEIMADTWQHIAIVNDPSTHDTTMYVGGAPVLRNVQAARGIAGAGWAAWKIGAGQWNGWEGGHRYGWRGCISEIRITKAALPREQWLTARSHRVVPTGPRQNLVGTAGDDVMLASGGGRLTGGEGRNTFVVPSLRQAGDTVTDFKPGQDQINLRMLLAEAGLPRGDALASGHVRAVASSAGAVVQVDPDGANGPATFRSVLILRGVQPAQIVGASHFQF